MQSSSKKPAAQVAIAEKAMALKAAVGVKSAKPSANPPSVRLLDKHDIVAITGVTYPTVWAWMRADKFPRSRIVGGKSMWLSTEVDQWLAGLPVRKLKGDQPSESEVAA
jgi:predicted DNA-binding transcriptional regulator AlpA